MADSAPLAKHGPRKKLTREQIITLAIRQASAPILCGCGCGEPLLPKCIDEHRIPRENLAADVCDHIDNRALFNVDCAKKKTVRDMAIIASSRHQRGGKGSQRAKQIARGCSSIKGRREIKSAGFGKADGFKHRWPKQKFRSVSRSASARSTSSTDAARATSSEGR